MLPTYIKRNPYSYSSVLLEKAFPFKKNIPQTTSHTEKTTQDSSSYAQTMSGLLTPSSTTVANKSATHQISQQNDPQKALSTHRSSLPEDRDSFLSKSVEDKKEIANEYDNNNEDEDYVLVEKSDTENSNEDYLYTSVDILPTASF